MTDHLNIEPLFTFRLFLDDYILPTRTTEERNNKHPKAGTPLCGVKLNTPKFSTQTRRLEEFELFMGGMEPEREFGEDPAETKKDVFSISSFVVKKESSLNSDMNTRVSFGVNATSLKCDDLRRAIGSLHCDTFRRKLLELVEEKRETGF